MTPEQAGRVAVATIATLEAEQGLVRVADRLDGELELSGLGELRPELRSSLEQLRQTLDRIGSRLQQELVPADGPAPAPEGG